MFKIPFFTSRLSLLLTAVLLGAPGLMVAQQQSAQADTTQKIQVVNALQGEYFQSDNSVLQKLSGNVVLSQANTLVYCDSAVIDNINNRAVLMGDVVFEQGDSLRAYGDSAVFKGNEREAELFGNAVLINGEQELYTSRLHYDLNEKIATYHEGATLSRENSQLQSQHGYYYVNQDMVFFKGDVVVTDPEFTLRSDTMSFNTVTQRVQFLAPTLITQRESRLYTEGGYYDLKNEKAVFDKNPQYENKEQRGKAEVIRYNGTTKLYRLEGKGYIREPDRFVRADTIQYNAETEEGLLIGQAYFQDSLQEIDGERIAFDSRNKRYVLSGRGRVSDPPNIIEADSLDFNDELGNGLALGNVIWRDTSAKTELRSHRADYNKQSDFVQAYGGFGSLRRPLLKSLVETDTLYMSADTLTAYQTDTISKNKVLLGYRDVRIYKSDLQGVCDSLSYSTEDSIFWMYKLDTLPMVWSDTSQFSADTILIGMRDSKIDKIWLRKDAFMLNSPDERMFNQIKGSNCTAYFKENELHEMLVVGNAQALYYAQNEQKEYVGLNETFCSEMRMFFADNQVEGIRFYTEPQGTFVPMRKAGKETRKLDGFLWEKGRRPQSLLSLY